MSDDRDTTDGAGTAGATTASATTAANRRLSRGSFARFAHRLVGDNDVLPVEGHLPSGSMERRLAQLAAADNGGGAREGRPRRLLDVHLHQLAAHARPTSGPGSRSTGSRPGRRRRPLARVPVRAGPRQRPPGREGDAGRVSGRGRQRLAVWKAFSNQYWPALYIVDARDESGTTTSARVGTSECETVIQRLLREAGRDGIADDWSRSSRRVSRRSRLGEPGVPGDVSRLPRGPRASRLPGRRARAAHAYPRRSGCGSTSGRSRGLDGGAGRVVLNAADGRIAFRFHARDVHLVMGPPTRGTSVPFRVLSTGAARAAHGSTSTSRATDARPSSGCYQLIRQRGRSSTAPSRSRSSTPGAEAYAFTFG